MIYGSGRYGIFLNSTLKNFAPAKKKVKIDTCWAGSFANTNKMLKAIMEGADTTGRIILLGN